MPVSVFPTGVTIYNPHKCWNGFTLFQAAIFEGSEAGAVLIDMNGNVCRQWKGLEGFPNKLLPGGFVMGSTGVRDPEISFQDMTDLVQVDWQGNIVWKFNKYEFISDPGHRPGWMARQHHDYQREGNPVGYYVPDFVPLADSGNTLLLCHKNILNSGISDKPLLDDTIIEVDWDGRIVWEWAASEHTDEMGFSEVTRTTLFRNPNPVAGNAGDWLHMNSVSTLGPNKLYDTGDGRFHPGNIIWSSRQASFTGITDKRTGKIVWRLGPDYDISPELQKPGWIIGQHHAHMIPRGLPGEGNILIFDNGGSAGYGLPNPGSPTGTGYALRDFSRVLELDPLTLEVVWQYPPFDTPAGGLMHYLKLYSKFISSAQRLPNGNTLIVEGGSGRFIEVTPAFEIVWEYVSPYYGKKIPINHVYRAYRYPYEWAPMAGSPEEKAVDRRPNSEFKVCNSVNRGIIDIKK